MSHIDDRVALRTFDQKGDGTIYFRHQNLWILLSIKRVTDKKESNLLVKKHNLTKPASQHVIKALGFRIVVTDENVEIFTYSKHPMTVGEQRWLYNVQKSNTSASFVCTIALRVSYADKPTKVDFLTKQKIDAALAAYRYGVEQCEYQLREELMRIYSDASHRLKEELESEDEEEAPKSVEKPKTKRMVRFKSRS